MRHLADDGDVDETFDEAPHNRCGDKACHPAHAHESECKEKNANQDSEGGGQRNIVRGTLGCDGADIQCGDQTRSRVRTDHELTRRAEQRIGE
jgi:hypothetical protein